MTMRPSPRLSLFVTLLLGGCVSTPAPLDAPRDEADDADDASLGAFPAAVVAPEGNPITDERVALGRMLFWDPILSGDADVACATCHHPAFAYADGRARSLGTGATGLGPARVADSADVVEVARNAPTVLDTAFNGWTRLELPIEPESAPMFWDARERSLERQALGPLTAAAEMRGPHLSADQVLPEIVARLGDIAEYRALFASAFGSEEIDVERITGAIASFERTLVARGSSYDRYMAGDETALDAAQRRGLAVFNGAGCAACHGGPMFSDYRLHRLGRIEVDPANGAVTDAFRTPSLREVTRTAPYMQDGSLGSLEAVLTFYRDVDRRLDPALGRLRPIPPPEGADLLRFLAALSDGTFDAEVPASVPSGLPPGAS